MKLHPFHPDQPVWTCPDCKSIDIVDCCYVNPNTNQVLESLDNYRWCNRCEEDTDNGEIKYFDEILYRESREFLESEGKYVHPNPDLR